MIEVGLKPREPRQTVLIRARMRTDLGWSDATIHNLSSNGLMVEASVPAERGAYIEIRRGRHVIVGRAMWRHGLRFGIRSQDRLAIADIIAEPVATDRVKKPGADSAPALLERRAEDRQRASVRLDAKQQRSRWLGSALQFSAIVLAGFGAAGLTGSILYRLLFATTQSIMSALS